MEDDGVQCQICYDAAPSVRLEPCGHEEFCTNCVTRCDSCPLCRAEIDDRVPLDGEPLEPSEGGAGTVRVFRQKFTLEDAIELHAFAPLEALACV